MEKEERKLQSVTVIEKKSIYGQTPQKLRIIHMYCLGTERGN